jgi:hypothetical protein
VSRRPVDSTAAVASSPTGDIISDVTHTRSWI